MSPIKSHRQRPSVPFARLEARITPDQKKLFQKAAAIEGRTLTDFVISCVSEEAQRVVLENEIIRLTRRDQKVFIEALLNPPKPNQAMRKAARLHATIIGDTDSFR